MPPGRSPSCTDPARGVSTAPEGQRGGGITAAPGVLFGVLALTAGALALRLPLIARFPHGWDAVDFALALARYNLAAMQPHFPGYPVYIAAARLAQRWQPDPFLALGAVSAVAGALAVAAAYLLGRWVLGEWLGAAARGGQTGGASGPAGAAPAPPAAGRVAAWAAAAVALWLALSPLAWLASGQPMSDSLGLLGYLATLLAAWRWLAAPPGRGAMAAAAAGACLGITLGVRLSYFPLATTLAAVAWLRRTPAEGPPPEPAAAPGRAPAPAIGPGQAGARGRGRGLTRFLPWREVAAAALGLALGVGPWLAWQVAQEGAARLAAMALQFTAGHLTDWGGAVTAGGGQPGGFADTGAGSPPVGRAARFFLYNWLGMGLGGPAAAPRLGWGVAAVVAGGLALALRHPPPRRVALFLAAWGAPYLAWAYLGQNPANPRHVLPLVPPAMVAVAGGWAAWAAQAPGAPGPAARPVQAGTPRRAGTPAVHRARFPAAGHTWVPAARPALAAGAAAVLLACTGGAGWPLARAQAEGVPPVVQLARYLTAHVPAQGTLVFTWEEERVIRYYHPQYPAIRLRSPGRFWQALLAAPGRPERVLATGAVLDGLGPGGDEIRAFFRPVATFTGDPRLYPTYHRIVLYAAGPEIYDHARRR